MRNPMQETKNIFARFYQDESGATAIEYVVIAAFLSIAIAATVFVIGGDLDANYFQPVANSF